VAIILDESAQAVIARRRHRGKIDRIHVRFDHGSFRASTPVVFVVGWAPRLVPATLVHQSTGSVDVSTARYRSIVIRQPGSVNRCKR
jgi:hypothetical protein